MARLAPLLVACGMLALAGCGSPGGGEQSGGVATAVGVFTAPYLLVDLASGRLESRLAIPDLTTNAAYGTTTLVFRRIEATSVALPGSTGFGAQADEGGLSASTGIAFVAVFEVTQAQWTALGGGTPWTAPEHRAQAGFRTGAQVPAWGIDRDLAMSTLASYSAGRSYRLDLPSAALWEIACRAGTGTLFPWGDGRDADADVKPHAAVFETMAGRAGPLAVDGTRLPNAFGLYDMPGNVWEWVRDDPGWIRGGSWNDVLAMSRSANRAALDPATRHPLVGVRPVLVP
jgi:hypothetical protein